VKFQALSDSRRLLPFIHIRYVFKKKLKTLFLYKLIFIYLTPRSVVKQTHVEWVDLEDCYFTERTPPHCFRPVIAQPAIEALYRMFETYKSHLTHHDPYTARQANKHTEQQTYRTNRATQRIGRTRSNLHDNLMMNP